MGRVLVAPDLSETVEAFPPPGTAPHTTRDPIDNRAVRAYPFLVSACPDASSRLCPWGGQGIGQMQRYSRLPGVLRHRSPPGEYVLVSAQYSSREAARRWPPRRE